MCHRVKKDQALICISGITTSNYPDHYNNNEDEKWLIEAQVGQVILIFLTNLEDHKSCKWDWVQVVDGNGQQLLEKSCGYILPKSFISKTDRAIVKFHSDNSDTRMGFGLKYSFIATSRLEI